MLKLYVPKMYMLQNIKLYYCIFDSSVPERLRNTHYVAAEYNLFIWTRDKRGLYDTRLEMRSRHAHIVICDITKCLSETHWVII